MRVLFVPVLCKPLGPVTGETLGPVMDVGCAPRARASRVRVFLGPSMYVPLGPVMCEALGPVRLLPCACGGDVLSPATAVMMSPATAIQAAMRWCCDESGYCHR